nr:hypothetical protein [Saprospiraceae bacterium]
MIALLLLASVIFNTAILVVFKYFANLGVDIYKAIIYNYFVCIVMGVFFTGQWPLLSAFGEPYLPYMIFLGAIFVFGFNIAALTVRYYGLTITSILQRTAMVITVIYAVVVFNESLGALKITAIVCALIAITLINMPFRKPVKKILDVPVWAYLLPLTMFLINGVIDTTLFHIEASKITTTANLRMITGIFTCAAITGIIFGYFKEGHAFFRPAKKTLWAALALGLPNFFSIYFLLRLLGSGLDGSIAIPMNNVGILCLAAVLGFFMFGERLTVYKTWGLVLAIISVILFSQVI